MTGAVTGGGSRLVLVVLLVRILLVLGLWLVLWWGWLWCCNRRSHIRSCWVRAHTILVLIRNLSHVVCVDIRYALWSVGASCRSRCGDGLGLLWWWELLIFGESELAVGSFYFELIQSVLERCRCLVDGEASLIESCNGHSVWRSNARRARI